jgi:3-deoxy-D-arabino-heptulosonate 7-phosphate (DAHP) synthase
MTSVTCGDVVFGSPEIVLITALPLPDQPAERGRFITRLTSLVRQGLRMVHLGIFSPEFADNLSLVGDLRAATGVALLTEVQDPRDVAVAAEYCDMLEIGRDCMQNRPLLQAAGHCHRPILLRRGLSSTYQEWLQAADMMRELGNEEVVLCEGGIRAFDHKFYCPLDLNAVPVLKELSSYPIVVDPCRLSDRFNTVSALGCAAVAAGADGLLLVEGQQKSPGQTRPGVVTVEEEWADLLPNLRRVARAMGRLVREEKKYSRQPGRRIMHISLGVANDDY